MQVYDSPGAVSIQAVTRPYATIREMAPHQHNLDQFVSEVAVVTVSNHGQPLGFTVHSFCSISREPALISFCIDNACSLWPVIEDAGRFCVNILSEQQQHLAKIFSRAGGARFQTTTYHQGTSGIPILTNALTWIECSIATTYPAGEQSIVLGNVQSVQHINRGKPLIVYGGDYGTFKSQKEMN